MDHRLHRCLHHLAAISRPRSSGDAPRNPFRSEADAFRVLIMVVVAGAIVVAVTLLTSPAVGFALALALIAVGLWRAFGLLQTWRREGSAPRSDEEGRAGNSPLD